MQPKFQPPRRRPRQDQAGAVMLVVMLVLLTATALAGISLQATQYELRAAGHTRSALQTQYVSEAAMATTFAWVDSTSLDRKILLHLDKWNGGAAPDLSMFGEPTLDRAHGYTRDANRTMWSQQARLTAVTLPPISVRGAVTTDKVGSFGPRVAIHPGSEEPTATDPLASDYVVDMYDCRRLEGVGSPGSQVNQAGSGTVKTFQLYCVVTSRGRSFVWNGATKTWRTPAGNFLVNRFTLAHDSRGTIVSPAIVGN